MGGVLVDSSVLLDILTTDPRWYRWSAATLARLTGREKLVINPIIFAKVSHRFTRMGDADEALPSKVLEREEIPYEAAFLAGKRISPTGGAVARRHRPCRTSSSAPMQAFRDTTCSPVMSGATGPTSRH
jgi:predicted nucleic acid-binding protein